jgi:ATPase subunit of ABC transporter with duplicated ATPase domains
VPFDNDVASDICHALAPTESKRSENPSFSSHMAVHDVASNSNICVALALGLPGHNHLTPIVKLSGGQKSRVVFTSIALSNPHILLM